ncbi:PspA/IM30 family protein [Shouchella shacheensis]|uniref:PspA/IM30 family protein n=1 Tax=Shouchella shacheensis TaxID=1649580 RepID=UPI0007404990|nr:PspA/IM30 family protein [Shouchella shacheensis]
MFRFFNRVRTIISSELNSLLNKAEDPGKMLNQFIKDMEQDIFEVETAIAKQLSNKKLVEKQYENVAALVIKREQQAMKALKSGDEGLARRVLEDKQKQQDQADSLRLTVEEAERLSEELKEKLREMKDEYQEMKMKRRSLTTRSESAKARMKVNQSLSSVGDGAKNGFERMEEKVLQHEAEAESSDELRNANKSLDVELSTLESASGVDKELAAMKAKLQNKEEE